MKRIKLVKTEQRKWEDYSPDDKRRAKFILGTFAALILLSIINGFGKALLVTILFYTVYWFIRGKKDKSKRVPYFLTASVLLFLSFPVSASIGNITPTSKPGETQPKTASTEEKENKLAVVPTAPVDPEPEPTPKTVAADGPVLSEGELYRVTSIVDGDTIKVSMNGQTETIRFIGVDTPETKDPRKPVQCYGKEASSRMQHYAQSKSVRLEDDPSQGDRDKYGRLLRYVYTEDGKNIAYYMIKEGYAHEYTYSKPYKYQAEFRQAESYARENLLGLWSPDTCNGDTSQQVSGGTSSTPTPVPATTPPSDSAVYYANCTEAKAAGAAPLYQGQPGYRSAMDRDGDGVACE